MMIGASHARHSRGMHGVSPRRWHLPTRSRAQGKLHHRHRGPLFPAHRFHPLRASSFTLLVARRRRKPPLARHEPRGRRRRRRSSARHRRPRQRLQLGQTTTPSARVPRRLRRPLTCCRDPRQRQHQHRSQHRYPFQNQFQHLRRLPQRLLSLRLQQPSKRHLHRDLPTERRSQPVHGGSRRMRTAPQMVVLLSAGWGVGVVAHCHPRHRWRRGVRLPRRSLLPCRA